MKPEVYGLTDVGRCRKINQDELLVDPSRGLFAVADGMGGHAAGEVASQMAIEVVADTMAAVLDTADLDPGEVGQKLENAFRDSNRKICDSVLTRDEWRGMGTTIVAMVARGTSAVIGHVGDSRAYLLRDGELIRLTSDHSWVNEQVKMGVLSDDEAQRHPMRNIVTRALGNRAELEVDLKQQEIQAGDTYLLCSDGLNTMLSDAEIQRTLEESPDAEVACRKLVESANSRGGEDNVTVVVMRVP